MTEFRTFDAIHDCPHAPDSDPHFQESSLFVWFDRDGGTGGFWRLGQEAVRGELNSCFGVFGPEGLRFRSNVTGVPMRAGDRSETHMGWGSELRVDLDALRVRANFPDCEADLTFTDFFPRYDWFQLLDRPGHASHHFENAGTMKGRLRIGSSEIEIDALGYRDRSWGEREWTGLRGTRWWPCVFGPDLVVFLTASVHESGHGAYGYVVRDGVPATLRDVDLVASIARDAITPLAGTGTFTLPGGSRGEITHELVDGVVMHVRGYTAIESIGTARYGDRIGMSNYEICTNPAGGTQPPVLALGANNCEGLSHRS
jgi:hypothetical protein